MLQKLVQRLVGKVQVEPFLYPASLKKSPLQKILDLLSSFCANKNPDVCLVME